ncbi:ATPase, T2SS/T4P/T4SS family [Isosphaeraceae bacterium EP7]
MDDLTRTQHGAASRPGSPASDRDDGGLGVVLVKSGLLTSDHLKLAQRHADEHKIDLLQAALTLGLIPESVRPGLVASASAPSATPTGSLPVALSTPSPSALGPIPLSTDSSTDLSPASSSGLPSHVAAPSVPAASTIGGLPMGMGFVLGDQAKPDRDIRDELLHIAQTANAPDLLNELVGRAIDTRATDIHLDPQRGAYRVRYRIDGLLHDVVSLDTALTTTMISRIKVVANLRYTERRHPQDGRMVLEHAGLQRDLRISTLPTAMGEKIVIRIFESLGEAAPFEQLGLEPAQAEALTLLTRRPYGAVLTGGPVGAGKTTTLYSSLAKVNIPERNVMTIEDPIEYRLEGVNQVQVDPKIDLTFGEGLRAILRQDPNVLMIGEIRDTETAQIGIRASLTGVLVFSSIHASDAASSIVSLYNYGIPSYLLSSALQGIVSQRLVRKICPGCKVPYEADRRTLAALDLNPDEYEGLALFRGQGCSECFQTGYLGRTGVFEILVIEEIIRDLILQQTTRDVFRQVATDLGMQSLRQSAINKVLAGVTTVEEVHRVGLF